MNPELIISFVRLLADDTHLDLFDMSELADLRDAIRLLDCTLAKYLGDTGIAEPEHDGLTVESLIADGWEVIHA